MLADRLGIPVQRLKAETTSMEFATWCVYLERDLNERDSKDIALAQIAAEVRRVLHKNPRSVKVEDFYVTYNTGQHRKKEQAKKMANSKAFWLAGLGIKG